MFEKIMHRIGLGETPHNPLSREEREKFSERYVQLIGEGDGSAGFAELSDFLGGSFEDSDKKKVLEDVRRAVTALPEYPGKVSALARLASFEVESNKQQ